MTNRNIIGREFESNNRFRIYNACKHYYLSAIPNILQLHHKSCLDDLMWWLCSFVAASTQINHGGTYGRNP